MKSPFSHENPKSWRRREVLVLEDQPRTAASRDLVNLAVQAWIYNQPLGIVHGYITNRNWMMIQSDYWIQKELGKSEKPEKWRPEMDRS